MSDDEKALHPLLSRATIRQFISYFGVGGVSALVEWVVFYLLGRLFGMTYMPATVLAFLFSTTTNWLLGRRFTFRNSKLGKSKGKEALQVFFVSGIGLLANMGLMYLFVTLAGMQSSFLKTTAKILATGIVFIWNFLSRKLWIYKDT